MQISLASVETSGAIICVNNIQDSGFSSPSDHPRQSYIIFEKWTGEEICSIPALSGAVVSSPHQNACRYKAPTVAFLLRCHFSLNNKQEALHLLAGMIWALFEHIAVEVTHPAQTSTPCRWATFLDMQVLLWFLLNSHWCFKELKNFKNLSWRPDRPGPNLVVFDIGLKRLAVQINGRHFLWS